MLLNRHHDTITVLLQRPLPSPVTRAMATLPAAFLLLPSPLPSSPTWASVTQALAGSEPPSWQTPHYTQGKTHVLQPPAPLRPVLAHSAAGTLAAVLGAPRRAPSWRRASARAAPPARRRVPTLCAWPPRAPRAARLSLSPGGFHQLASLKLQDFPCMLPLFLFLDEVVCLKVPQKCCEGVRGRMKMNTLMKGHC